MIDTQILDKPNLALAENKPNESESVLAENKSLESLATPVYFADKCLADVNNLILESQNVELSTDIQDNLDHRFEGNQPVVNQSLLTNIKTSLKKQVGSSTLKPFGLFKELSAQAKTRNALGMQSPLWSSLFGKSKAKAENPSLAQVRTEMHKLIEAKVSDPQKQEQIKSKLDKSIFETAQKVQAVQDVKKEIELKYDSKIINLQRQILDKQNIQEQSGVSFGEEIADLQAQIATLEKKKANATKDRAIKTIESDKKALENESFEISVEGTKRGIASFATKAVVTAVAGPFGAVASSLVGIKDATKNFSDGEKKAIVDSKLKEFNHLIEERIPQFNNELFSDLQNIRQGFTENIFSAAQVKDLARLVTRISLYNWLDPLVLAEVVAIKEQIYNYKDVAGEDDKEIHNTGPNPLIQKMKDTMRGIATDFKDFGIGLDKRAKERKENELGLDTKIFGWDIKIKADAMRKFSVVAGVLANTVGAVSAGLAINARFIDPSMGADYVALGNNPKAPNPLLRRNTYLAKALVENSEYGYVNWDNALDQWCRDSGVTDPAQRDAMVKKMKAVAISVTNQGANTMPVADLQKLTSENAKKLVEGFAEIQTKAGATVMAEYTMALKSDNLDAVSKTIFDSRGGATWVTQYGDKLNIKNTDFTTTNATLDNLLPQNLNVPNSASNGGETPNEGSKVDGTNNNVTDSTSGNNLTGGNVDKPADIKTPGTEKPPGSGNFDLSKALNEHVVAPLGGGWNNTTQFVGKNWVPIAATTVFLAGGTAVWKDFLGIRSGLGRGLEKLKDFVGLGEYEYEYETDEDVFNREFFVEGKPVLPIDFEETAYDYSGKITVYDRDREFSLISVADMSTTPHKVQVNADNGTSILIDEGNTNEIVIKGRRYIVSLGDLTRISGDDKKEFYNLKLVYADGEPEGELFSKWESPDWVVVDTISGFVRGVSATSSLDGGMLNLSDVEITGFGNYQGDKYIEFNHDGAPYGLGPNQIIELVENGSHYYLKNEYDPSTKTSTLVVKQETF